MKTIKSSLSSILFAGLLLFSSACSKDHVEPSNPTAKNGVADRTIRSTILGPFSVGANLTKVADRQKMFVSAKPGFAAGIYFCDIYRSSAKVTLNAGQLMVFDTETGSTQIGYSDPSSETVGIASIQTGRTYEFSTYSIVPIYNSIGQSVGAGPFPQDLTGNVYTYSVYQP